MKGMNKFYRQLSREYNERGKYILNRVLPLVGKAVFVGGVGLMTYGGVLMKKDVEKGQKYFGLEAATSFVTGYALDEYMKTKNLIESIRKDKKENKNLIKEIDKANSLLEESLND